MTDRAAPPPRKPQGNTIPEQGETQERVPRMPHERDESASSQAPAEASGRRMGRIAHDSLREGQRDTDKGPVLDATYHEVRKEPGGR